MRRKGFTWVELILIIIILTTFLIVLVPCSANYFRQPVRRSSCQNNLKEMGLVYKMYANEARGEKFPPVQMRHYEQEGWGSQFAFAPEISAIWPEYLCDSHVLACMDEPDPPVFYQEEKCIFFEPATGKPFEKADDSYLYFGYVFDKTGEKDPLVKASLPESFKAILPEGVRVSAQFHAVWKALYQHYANEKESYMQDEDIPVLETLGYDETETVYRLRDGIERLLITDTNDPAASARAQSMIYIMLDRIGFQEKTPFNHKPDGCNVLYLDGHVEYIRFPGEAPCSNALAAGVFLYDSLMNATAEQSR